MTHRNQAARAVALIEGVCVSLLLVLVSCGAKGTLVLYEGPPRASHQVARLDLSHKCVHVTAIDSYDKGHFAINKKYVELLPGHHSVTVNYRSRKGTSSAPVVLEFFARADHIYKVKARAGYRRWTAWIIDTGDGSVVAGSDE